MLVAELGIVTDVRPLLILVFANAFISVTCVLNGRKVMMKILERLEKMKI